MKKVLPLFIAIIAFNSLIAQNALIVPPSMTGTTFDLTLQRDSMEFYPGVFTQTMGVSFPILGPTLIMQQGEVVNVNFDNQLGDTTTIHWHGMHVPSEVDGGPHTPIAPGTTWSPTFTVMDHASTMWYHPHLMHKTNAHVQMGIAGFVIVKDPVEAALDLPRTYGVDDVPLVFQTKTLDADKQIVIDMDYSVYDTLQLTNATREAYFDAPAQVVRFRLLNGSSERSYNIGLSEDATFYVIGSDGGLLEAPVALTRLQLDPGERYEILVDLVGMEGNTVNIMNYGSTLPNAVYGTAPGNIGGMGGASIAGYETNPLNGADFALLTLNVVAQTADPVTTIPSALVTVEELNIADVDEERGITMSSIAGGPDGALNGPFQLNGAPFDIDVINYEVPLNNTEIWTLTNASMISHPFHIHDVQFNLLEIDGNTPPAHMQGWKDIVLVPPFQGTIKFITKFEDFANPVVPYMYHCHILTHEETGMMGQFTVVDSSIGINDIDSGSKVSFYPNPVNNGTLNINTNGENVEVIEIYALDGKLLKSVTVKSEKLITVDVSAYSGAILVRIISENGAPIGKAVIVANN